MKIIIIFLLISLAALAIPAAIGYGIHNWVVVDIELKHAQWSGVNVWLFILCSLITYPVFLTSKQHKR